MHELEKKLGFFPSLGVEGLWGLHGGVVSPNWRPHVFLTLEKQSKAWVWIVFNYLKYKKSEALCFDLYLS
jgi:hypothetical protein